MNLFPDLIRLKIINENGNKPLQNIAVIIKFFANRKNDHYLIPLISNQEGLIEITKEQINKKMDDNMNTFIMDYSSNLDDCQPKIDFKLMDKNEIERAIKAMNMYKGFMGITEKEIDNLSKAENEKYNPVSKVVEFKNQGDVIEIDLITKEITTNL